MSARFLPSLIAAGLLATACGSDAASTDRTTGSTGSPVAVETTLSALPQRVEVVETVVHDPAAFTQGLVFAPDGRLFESTGLEGESTLREIDPSTGEVLRSVALDDSLFGEGLALVGDRLVQITWQDERAIVYDVETFTEVDSFTYDGEGWGLCHDGTRLVMSDGSAALTFRDPATFAVLGSITVTLDGVAVSRLNELECVDGMVYANVWQSDRIVRIDPATGVVETVIDAAGLARPEGADVLNGIAVDPDGGLWLTGKWWDAMYRVELVPT